MAVCYKICDTKILQQTIVWTSAISVGRLWIGHDSRVLR